MNGILFDRRSAVKWNEWWGWRVPATTGRWARLRTRWRVRFRLRRLPGSARTAVADAVEAVLFPGLDGRRRRPVRAEPRRRRPARPTSLEPDDDGTAFRIRQVGPRQPIEGADRGVAWGTMRAVQATVGEAYALSQSSTMAVDAGQPDLYEPDRAYVEADTLCGGWWPRGDYVLVSERPSTVRVVDDRPHCDDGPAIVWPDGWSLSFVHGVRVPGLVPSRQT